MAEKPSAFGEDMGAISINVFMIFIYLNIFISEEPIGGDGPRSANHMQIGCNMKCFVLSQVYSGCALRGGEHHHRPAGASADFLFMDIGS